MSEEWAIRGCMSGCITGVSDGPWDYVTMNTNHFWEGGGGGVGSP